VLAEIISDELDYDIMNRAYSKLTGPYFVRNMLRSKMVKMIDSAVLAIVKPAWAGMAKAVENMKPKIEPKIRGAVEPIFKAEAGLVDKLKGILLCSLPPLPLACMFALLLLPTTLIYDSSLMFILQNK
jgi:hypothetical protein